MITHILHTLAGLDYTPSVLSLVRIALQRRMLDQPQFEPAVEALERMLRRIGDSGRGGGQKIDLAADAYTLRALMYAAEGTREGDNNALRWFRRAYEIGVASPEPSSVQAPATPSENEIEDASKASEGIESAQLNPRWQWKASFALGVAAIRLKRGEVEKARDLYRMASLELDNATGYYGMADVLERLGKADTAEYVEALEKAAVSDNLDAARKMGTREWSRAAEEGLTKWERRKRQVVAEEWMAVAGVVSVGHS
jgi:tetratricopeptide (TPR) repeat protein